ncbi:MAG: hypothetical protein ACI4T9_05170, partial [Prevotella sp.]
MKKIFALLASCLLTVAAAHASNTLILHLTNGQTISYVLLQEQPVLCFQGDSIIVTTSTSKSNYDMHDVSYFNYDTSTPTGIKETTTDKGMQRNGNHLSFDGLPAGSTVTVYDTAGQLYLQTKADGQGHAELSLDELA